MRSYSVYLDIFRTSNTGQIVKVPVYFHRIGRISFSEGKPLLFLINPLGELDPVPMTFNDCQVGSMSVYLEGQYPHE